MFHLSGVIYPEIWRCYYIPLRKYCVISRGRRSIHTREMCALATGNMSADLEMLISCTHIHVSCKKTRYLQISEYVTLLFHLPKNTEVSLQSSDSMKLTPSLYLIIDDTVRTLSCVEVYKNES